MAFNARPMAILATKIIRQKYGMTVLRLVQNLAFNQGDVAV
jgi:hypothetical protein